MENNQKKLMLLQDLGMSYPNQKSKRKRRYGIYKCFCGNEFKAIIESVENEHRKSCGCLKTKHNSRKHRLYSIWNNMMQRCYKINRENYMFYGSRGITVCDEWHNIENFINDMFPSYQEGLTLDRENNDKGYSPSNCRWTNHFIQARNTRKLRVNNTSGYRGVVWVKSCNKWHTQIGVNNKRIHLGNFDTALNGALAYDNYITVNNLEHTKNFT